MSKKDLGQFFTTNYDYIFQGITIPENIHRIVEPFCGNADLLNFIDRDLYDIECYDIAPQHDFIIQQNTLINPPDYTDKFILTNPPYLARNKSTDKTIYDLYGLNDLYKCFIKTIIQSECLGGLIIIPLNFLCSIRKTDINLRKLFIQKFWIKKINIFEEQVFDDTTYTVCSILFELNTTNETYIKIIPSDHEINFLFSDENNYSIGGELYNKINNSIYTIIRATHKNKNSENITNILIKCIDDSKDNLIHMSYVQDENRYIDETINLSARSYATLIIEPKITKEQQLRLIDNFNNFLNEKRELYHSLFITNYRDKYRKRISFDLVYNICYKILEDI